jgi:hypothetical protein
MMSLSDGLVVGVTDAIKNDDGTTDTLDKQHALIATLVFVIALFFNLNAAMWSLQNSRYRLNLQVAYISAVAAYTLFLIPVALHI